MPEKSSLKTNSLKTNSAVGFLVKVLVASVLLSLLIKYGGPLLPIDSPYTARLNGLVTTIILVPSLTVGAGLIFLLKAQRDRS